jgi:hypothetical protein
MPFSIFAKNREMLQMRNILAKIFLIFFSKNSTNVRENHISQKNLYKFSTLPPAIYLRQIVLFLFTSYYFPFFPHFKLRCKTKLQFPQNFRFSNRFYFKLFRKKTSVKLIVIINDIKAYTRFMFISYNHSSRLPT